MKNAKPVTLKQVRREARRFEGLLDSLDRAKAYGRRHLGSNYFSPAKPEGIKIG